MYCSPYFNPLLELFQLKVSNFKLETLIVFDVNHWIKLENHNFNFNILWYSCRAE